MQDVIKLLLDQGYEPHGHTRSETVRFITVDSYPFAGRETTLGGRQRFALPGTNKRATVGKQITCLYEVENHQTKNSQAFKTKDVEAIKRALD